MSSANFYSYTLKSGSLNVGLSAIAELPVGANVLGVEFIKTTGSSLWIGGNSMTWGDASAFPVGSEKFEWETYRGPLFFAAGGASAVVSYVQFLSTNQGS